MSKIIQNISIKNFDAVFFDLDGTLFDTATDLLLALNYLLKKYNHNAITLEQLLPYISKGSKEIIRALITQENIYIPDNILEQYLEIYKTEYIDLYHNMGHKHTSFFPGVEKTIELLNYNNIPWGIITNKTEKLTFPMAELFDLKNKYNCKTIVCADTTSKAKPHPEPMLKACENLKVNPKNCIFIGDALTDIEAGKSVNMTTILAAYGYIPQDILDNRKIENWGADLIIKSPVELINMF